MDLNRVKDIFLAATEQPDEAARTAYLDRVCGGDNALRDRVEALLRSHDSAGSFLGAPAAVMPDVARDETIPLDPSPAPDACTDRPDQYDWLRSYLSPATRSDSLGKFGHYEVLQVVGKGASESCCARSTTLFSGS